MSLVDVESEIHDFLEISSNNALVRGIVEFGKRLFVIKYTHPKFLPDILDTQCLFAAKTPGYTWGDAVYVAPLAYPLTTMMYGAVGVVGWVDTTAFTFYNAVDPKGISLYQDWIRYHADLYRQLTTTVHANEANRLLRNDFRTHFSIDCIYFRPDERCRGYVEESIDIWLALTAWGTTKHVVSGTSHLVKDLKWCAIGTESFETETYGFLALLHPSLSRDRTFEYSRYSSLSESIRKAYDAGSRVIIYGVLRNGFCRIPS